jgi:hypothetical protein
MRKHLKALLVASTMVVGFGIAPAIYAHESGGGDGSMRGRGMMGRMMNMVGMSGGMDEHCNETMQSMMGQHDSKRPNEQWRHGEPAPQQDLRSGGSRG